MNRARMNTGTMTGTTTIMIAALALLAGGCTTVEAVLEPKAQPRTGSQTQVAGDATTGERGVQGGAGANAGEVSSIEQVTGTMNAERPERRAGARGQFVADVAAAGTPATDQTAQMQNDALSDALEGLKRSSFADEGADFNPRISGDGRFMVFASTQHRHTSDLYIKQVGSRTVTQLTSDPSNDAMPAISPDGKRIAFASDRTGAWGIYLMPAGGGRAVQLSDGHTHDLHPSFSPDGTRVVFSRLGTVSGRWELWVMSVDQPGNAEFIGYGLFPEWCPTGGTGVGGSDKILFQRGRERGQRAFALWTLDYSPGSAGNVTQIVGGREFAAINPTWSPDGMWLAYSRVPREHFDAGTSAGAELWISSLDGASSIQVSGRAGTNVMPTWGRDGRIYFVSDRSGSENIWSVSTERALAGAKGGTPAVAGTATGTETTTAAAKNTQTAAVNAPTAGEQPVEQAVGQPVEQPAMEPGVATVPTEP
jgi:TolB protein